MEVAGWHSGRRFESNRDGKSVNNEPYDFSERSSILVKTAHSNDLKSKDGSF